MELSSFEFPRRARRPIKRVGRGRGSGHGKTCCRGGKGQSARTGSSRKRHFEGGQTPIQRRLPKRGFTNIFRKEFVGLNVERLAEFPAGTKVTVDLLKERGLVPRSSERVKILGDGELGVKLAVVADGFTATAKAKIEAAGGSTATNPVRAVFRPRRGKPKTH
jgi:large subunit ribosomal protein L15